MSNVDATPFLTTEIDWNSDGTTTPTKQWLCREYHAKYDPHQGRKITQRWTCKDPHNCPYCRKVKQDELRERLTPLLDNNTIKVQLIPLAERDNINRTYSTDKVLHIPGLEYCYTLIDDLDAPGVLLTPTLLEEIISKGIPPKKKRISGGLGKINKPAPIVDNDSMLFEEKGEVTHNVFKYVDTEGDNITSKELIEKIDVQVVEETQDLNPTTIDEVQYALYVLEQKTVEIAARYNVEILFLYTEISTVFISKIDWQERRKLTIDTDLKP